MACRPRTTSSVVEGPFLGTIPSTFNFTCALCVQKFSLREHLVTYVLSHWGLGFGLLCGRVSSSLPFQAGLLSFWSGNRVEESFPIWMKLTLNNNIRNMQNL